MTESEWLSCREPRTMIWFLRDSHKLTERKVRLFGAAVCRRIWGRFKQESSRIAVEMTERYADEQATEEELLAAAQAADEARVWGGYAVEAAFAAASCNIEAA